MKQQKSNAVLACCNRILQHIFPFGLSPATLLGEEVVALLKIIKLEM